MSQQSDELKIETPKKPCLTEEEESEFARELAKMLSDSAADRPKQTSKGSLAAVSIPLLRKQQAEHSQATASSPEDGFMTFTLLGRKGTKAQVSSQSNGNESS